MRRPIDLFGKPPAEEENHCILPDYVTDLEERQEKVHEFARNKVILFSERMKVRLDKESWPVNFKECDADWLYQPFHQKGLSPKL